MTENSKMKRSVLFLSTLDFTLRNEYQSHKYTHFMHRYVSKQAYPNPNGQLGGQADPSTPTMHVQGVRGAAQRRDPHTKPMAAPPPLPPTNPL